LGRGKLVGLGISDPVAFRRIIALGLIEISACLCGGSHSSVAVTMIPDILRG
jgi:hypothetical protein